MLTQKLLAAVGLAGALLLGAATDASANPWRHPHFRPAPVLVAPVYRAPVVVAPVYRAPVVVAPVVPAPVVVPAPRVVVYPAPVYRPVRWHHHPWVHRHGYRW